MKCILSLSLVAFTSLASTVAAEQEPFEGQVLDLRSAPIHREGLACAVWTDSGESRSGSG